MRPWLGIGLLLDIRGSLAVIAGLMGMFIFVLGYGISLNLDVDCGCFGADDLAKQAGLVQAFWRDLVLGGIVVPYLYLSRWARSGKSMVMPEAMPAPDADRSEGTQ